MTVAFAVTIASTQAADSSSRQKARYYYLEGAREAANGNNAEAFAYFNKAYDLDTTYYDAAFSYGSRRLVIPTDTMQSVTELMRSLNLLKNYVDLNPHDIFAGRFYGYAATRLDTVEEAIRVYDRMAELNPAESYLLLNLAESYMMAQKYDEGIRTLNRYEKIEGKSQDTSLKKITLMMAKGDTIASVAEVEELVATSPTNPYYLILAGNLYELTGQNDSTLAYYQKAERLNPDNGAVKMALANYYMQKGDSVAYDGKIYEALLTEDFGLDDKLGILSEYLQTLIDEKGETARGDYLFSVLMEQYPHEADLLDLSARYNGAKGDFKKAIEQISYAIDLDPANVAYWSQLIRYQLADDDYRGAVTTYQKGKEHVVMPQDMTFMYGAALTQLEDYDEAVKTYGELIHSVNESLPVTTPVDNNFVRNSLKYADLMLLSTVYNILGDMYYKKGDIDMAFTAYDNSLYFYGSNPMTLNNYAYFIAETGGDLDKAQEMSRKAIHEDEGNPTYLDTYAWILYLKKDYKEALDYQTEAIARAEEAGDENAEYYHHMGDILFMNQEPARALENWEKALSLDPENGLLQKKVEHKALFFE